MKRINICWTCIRLALSRIHLVDKCLIIFMVVLLAQSAYTLFTNHAVQTDNTDNIDIIVRTSIAAIFGYFLSANFICHASYGRKKGGIQCGCLPEVSDSNGIQDPVDFSAQDDCACKSSHSENESKKSEREKLQEEIAAAGRLQTLVAAGIGIFCMVTLMLMRNVPALSETASASSSSAAIVAQFRDLVSGCVGFLIGCPTERSGKQRL